jgi:hypothetical protein
MPDDALLVNVAYDKQLVDYSDDMGVPAGHIDITDRKELAELFRYMSKDNVHKYIVCDIFFDPSLKTSADDSLFALIAAMPRIVIPMHEDGSPLPELICPKAAYSDYKTNVMEEDLLKYQYLQHRQASIPLYMWQELTGGRFERHCLLYRMNGRLVTNSVIMDYRTEMHGAYNAEGEKNYLNLEADLLELLRADETQAAEIFKDKIILIGDLTEHDIHATMAGMTPGVLINYNAYKMLADNRAATPVLLWVLLFVVFAVATMQILTGRKITDLLPRKGVLKSDMVQFLLSMAEFSIVLLIVNVLCYFVWGRFIEIFLWAGYFAVLKTIFDIYKLIKQSEDEKKNHTNHENGNRNNDGNVATGLHPAYIGESGSTSRGGA